MEGPLQKKLLARLHSVVAAQQWFQLLPELLLRMCQAPAPYLRPFECSAQIATYLKHSLTN